MPECDRINFAVCIDSASLLSLRYCPGMCRVSTAITALISIDILSLEKVEIKNRKVFKYIFNINLLHSRFRRNIISHFYVYSPH